MPPARTDGELLFCRFWGHGTFSFLCSSPSASCRRRGPSPRGFVVPEECVRCCGMCERAWRGRLGTGGSRAFCGSCAAPGGVGVLGVWRRTCMQARVPLGGRNGWHSIGAAGGHRQHNFRGDGRSARRPRRRRSAAAAAERGRVRACGRRGYSCCWPLCLPASRSHGWARGHSRVGQGLGGRPGHILPQRFSCFALFFAGGCSTAAPH